MNKYRVTYLAGIIGSLIIAGGSLITAITYEGRYWQAYSFLNHNISELGELGVSELANVFNSSLILGGIFLVVFMISLSFCVLNRGMIAVSVLGMISAFAVVLVGVFPTNQFEEHTIAAFTFFLVGLLTVIAFTLFIKFSNQTVLSKRLVIPSLISAISFVAFLFLPPILYPDLDQEQMLAGPGAADRETIWLPSLLEWLILFTVIIWVLAVSIELYKKEKEAKSQV